MTDQRHISAFINAALESSVFLDPRSPGLTAREVLEATKQAGFEKNESLSALQELTAFQEEEYERNLLPHPQMRTMWVNFAVWQAPEHRNILAFDFIHKELVSLVRSVGFNNAWVQRDALVDRAISASIPRVDIEAAITLWVINEYIFKKGELLRLAEHRLHQILPTEEYEVGDGRLIPSEARQQAHAIVRDIVRCRVGRLSNSLEPLQAFESVLTQYESNSLKLWWEQALAEINALKATPAPLSISILCAALSAEALRVYVRLASSSEPADSSISTAVSTNCLSFKQLIDTAAQGERAIIDKETKQRALNLSDAGQCAQFSDSSIQTTPELMALIKRQAEAAIATTELLVRSVLAWVEKNL